MGLGRRGAKEKRAIACFDHKLKNPTKIDKTKSAREGGKGRVMTGDGLCSASLASCL